MDYYYYQKEKQGTKAKAKRNRESNWDSNEKRSLIKIVQRYKSTIDNNRNDSIWIRRKNAAWEAIQRAMVAEGHRRGVKSVRQQWQRMKGEARKKSRDRKAAYESDKTPPPAQPHTRDPLDCVIKEEDETFQPQDTSCLSFTDPNPDSDKDMTPVEDNLLCVESILNSIPSPDLDQIDSSGIASATSTSTFDPPLLPSNDQIQSKPVVGRSVLHARLRQIEDETQQKAELHAIEVAQRHEIHSLKVRQLKEQIEQQRQLFEAQLEKLKTSS